MKEPDNTALPTPNPKGEGIPAALDKRFPFDTAEAKRLLAEAGYPNGFAFTLVAGLFLCPCQHAGTNVRSLHADEPE